MLGLLDWWFHARAIFIPHTQSVTPVFDSSHSILVLFCLMNVINLLRLPHLPVFQYKDDHISHAVHVAFAVAALAPAAEAAGVTLARFPNLKVCVRCHARSSPMCLLFRDT
jgi:hypothetical protein